MSDELPRTEADEDERWRPPGAITYYRVSMELRPDLKVEGSMTLKPSHDEVDFATLLVSRIGGPSRRDELYRAQLYPFIGAAAVASGKIEANMKRLIVVLEKGTSARFDSVELTWTQLHRRLRTAARGALLAAEAAGEEVELRDGHAILPVAAQALLDWAEKEGTKEARDHIIHSSWWDFADIGILRSRFFQDGRSELQYLDWPKLQRDVRLLGEYARRLDDLVQPGWNGFYLPRDDAATRLLAEREE